MTLYARMDSYSRNSFSSAKEKVGKTSFKNRKMKAVRYLDTWK